jgi:NAD(P) transhydrogenase subunit alpha
MDARSSQATVAGYKATLLAADAFGKFFPRLTTAAGTMTPAKVLVIGAGVAGLMAIATACRLGAVVEAFDRCPAVREDVLSLGATFIDMEPEAERVAKRAYGPDVSEEVRQSEHEVLARHVQQADVIVTTAHAPGQRAPLLVTETMVAAMQPGSVIVDLAAAYGGNCACTEPGHEVVRHGVKILGLCHVPSLMPVPASQMYANNIMAVLRHVIRDGVLHLDLTDQITRGACVTHAGIIQHADIRQASASVTSLTSA